MTDEEYTIDCRSAAAAAGGVLATVRLAGEFDLDACDELRSALLGAVPTGQSGRITVDLAEVTFIDSETVRALLDGYAAAQLRGIDYRLVRAGGLVKRVLKVMGLTELAWVEVSSAVT